MLPFLEPKFNITKTKYQFVVGSSGEIDGCAIIHVPLMPLPSDRIVFATWNINGTDQFTDSLVGSTNRFAALKRNFTTIGTFMYRCGIKLDSLDYLLYSEPIQVTVQCKIILSVVGWIDLYNFMVFCLFLNLNNLFWTEDYALTIIISHFFCFCLKYY